MRWPVESEQHPFFGMVWFYYVPGNSKVKCGPFLKKSQAERSCAVAYQSWEKPFNASEGHGGSK